MSYTFHKSPLGDWMELQWVWDIARQEEGPKLAEILEASQKHFPNIPAGMLFVTRAKR